MSKRIGFLSGRTLSLVSRLPQRAAAVPNALRAANLHRNQIPCSVHFQQRRNYSEDGEPKATMPTTSSGMGHIWPSPFKMVKNFMITRFILPRIDPDFSLPEFMNGAKKAIEVISLLMSQGDYAAMENFVEPIVVASIKDSLKGTSLREQQELAVDIPDIMVSFPYSIETLFRTEGAEMQRRIDILVVCHVLKGWGITKENQDVVVELRDSEEMRRKVQFVNYQFTRTYVEAKESSWLVTGVHHFKPNMEE
uniref:Uncharacterized protein C2orf47, mitochondrial n=1 Tax=Lygus hesperus TaxID=30085 RepID=A0A0A9YEJ5_LYGHE